MSDLLIRLGILALTLGCLALLFGVGRLFVARQRQLVLASGPLALPLEGDRAPVRGKVRILAFSSPDCRQCHTLQQPALRRLQSLRGEEVDVVEIDARTSPELTRRYRILTLPSTVVLHPTGEAHAVNYGFAPMTKLQKQIDALLIPAHSSS